MLLLSAAAGVFMIVFINYWREICRAEREREREREREVMKEYCNLFLGFSEIISCCLFSLVYKTRQV